MTVFDALKLLKDGIEHTQSSFSTCHSWSFEIDGKRYRLAEWKGDKLFLETERLPRTTLHEISLKGGKPRWTS